MFKRIRQRATRKPWWVCWRRSIGIDRQKSDIECHSATQMYAMRKKNNNNNTRLQMQRSIAFNLEKIFIKILLRFIPNAYTS